MFYLKLLSAISTESGRKRLVEIAIEAVKYEIFESGNMGKAVKRLVPLLLDLADHCTKNYAESTNSPS